jgi:hypothetical protein
LPGKNNIADLLSRNAPVQSIQYGTLEDSVEDKCFVDSILGSEPHVDCKLDDIRQAQENDPES